MLHIIIMEIKRCVIRFETSKEKKVQCVSGNLGKSGESSSDERYYQKIELEPNDFIPSK
jgi:hypothetical protein